MLEKGVSDHCHERMTVNAVAMIVPRSGQDRVLLSSEPPRYVVRRSIEGQAGPNSGPPQKLCGLRCCATPHKGQRAAAHHTIPKHGTRDCRKRCLSGPDCHLRIQRGREPRRARCPPAAGFFFGCHRLGGLYLPSLSGRRNSSTACLASFS